VAVARVFLRPKADIKTSGIIAAIKKTLEKLCYAWPNLHGS
jgi:hypothetical protein